MQVLLKLWNDLLSCSSEVSGGERTRGRLFGPRRLNVVKRETVGIVTPGLRPGFLLSASGRSPLGLRRCRIVGVVGREQLQGVEKVHQLSWNLCQHALGQRFPGPLCLFGWKRREWIRERERQNMSRFSIMKNWGINEITRWKVEETTMMTTGRKGTRSCGRSLQKRFLVKGWKCKPDSVSVSVETTQKWRLFRELEHKLLTCDAQRRFPVVRTWWS